MKKIISILILFSFFISPVATADPLAPTWNEFCPDKYTLPQDKYNFEIEQKAWSVPDSLRRDLMYLSIINAPKAWKEDMEIFKGFQKNKQIIAEAPMYHYWNNRKIEFDNEITTCQGAVDKSSCYMQVRQLETYKTVSDQQTDLMKQQNRRAALARGFQDLQNQQLRNQVNNLQTQMYNTQYRH